MPVPQIRNMFGKKIMWEHVSEHIADVAGEMLGRPNICTDGSRDQDLDALVGVVTLPMRSLAGGDCPANSVLGDYPCFAGIDASHVCNLGMEAGLWLTPWFGITVLDLRFVRLTPDSSKTFVTDGDIGDWPYTDGILVEFTSFLCTHCLPEGEIDLGKFERWVGHRLLLEKTVPLRNRTGRILSSPPLPGLGRS